LVDAKFPHAFTARLVSAKVAEFDAVYATDNGRFGFGVSHLPQPFEIDIPLVFGDVYQSSLNSWRRGVNTAV
jgi:hypothetical protein